MPPIPLLDGPHAVFVAQADTADRIGNAVVRQMLGRPVARAYFGALWVAATAVLIAFDGITGAVQAVFVIGFSPLALLAVRRKRVRSFAAHAATFSGPGMTLAAKFGPDAMDIHTATGMVRHHYSAVRSLQFHGPAAMLSAGLLMPYPRELFPADMIAAIPTTPIRKNRSR